MHWGSPGTWETLPFPSSFRASEGSSVIKTPGPWALRSASMGAKCERKGGTRWAKETKPAGMDGRESELLVVPAMRGNPPQGTLRREGEAES